VVVITPEQLRFYITSLAVTKELKKFLLISFSPSSHILLTFFSHSSHNLLTIFSLLSSFWSLSSSFLEPYVSDCCSVSERSNFFLKRADRDFLLYTNTMSPSRQKSHITEINKDTHTRETYCEDVEATLIYLATLSTICISWSIANLPKEAALTVEH
jgi:hypothetical protein